MFLSSQLSITASRTMTSVSGRMAMTSPSLSTTTPRTVMFDMATFWDGTIFPVNTSMLRVVSYRIFVSWAKRALSPRRSRHFYLVIATFCDTSKEMAPKESVLHKKPDKQVWVWCHQYHVVVIQFKMAAIRGASLKQVAKVTVSFCPFDPMTATAR